MLRGPLESGKVAISRSERLHTAPCRAPRRIARRPSFAAHHHEQIDVRITMRAATRA
jgi:hypothetical protein